MRFVRRIPATDKKLSEKLVAENWRKIKEPKNLLTAILASVPLMFINGLLSISIIIPIYNPLKSIIANYTFTVTIKEIVYFIIAAFILIIVHELIHMIFIPHFIKSDKTYWGITLNGGFVTTTERISKIRFIIISIMPYFLLSIVVPIILGFCNVLNNFIMALIILNAMASSVDIFNLFLILCQTPKNSYIINNGFETYFK